MEGKLLLAGMTLFLLAGKVAAGFLSGSELKSACEASERYDKLGGVSNVEDAYLAGKCMNYVLGVYDSIEDEGFCSPEDLFSGQATDVVTQYLDTHPEELDQNANVLVKRALVRAFPCGKKKPAAE